MVRRSSTMPYQISWCLTPATRSLRILSSCSCCGASVEDLESLRPPTARCKMSLAPGKDSRYGQFMPCWPCLLLLWCSGGSTAILPSCHPAALRLRVMRRPWRFLWFLETAAHAMLALPALVVVFRSEGYDVAFLDNSSQDALAVPTGS